MAFLVFKARSLHRCGGFFIKLPHLLAAKPCLKHGTVLQLPGVGTEGVSTENGEVSILTGADLSFDRFLKAGIGAGFGKAVQRLPDGEGFRRQIRVRIVQILPCDGALDACQYIRCLYGTVGAVADRGAKIQKGFPGIAGLGQLISHSLVDDVAIVIQENGLGVHM